jgi:hypothetical protein
MSNVPFPIVSFSTIEATRPRACPAPIPAALTAVIWNFPPFIVIGPTDEFPDSANPAPIPALLKEAIEKVPPWIVR